MAVAGRGRTLGGDVCSRVMSAVVKVKSCPVFCLSLLCSNCCSLLQRGILQLKVNIKVLSKQTDAWRVLCVKQRLTRGRESHSFKK